MKRSSSIEVYIETVLAVHDQWLDIEALPEKSASAFM